MINRLWIWCEIRSFVLLLKVKMFFVESRINGGNVSTLVSKTDIRFALKCA